MILVLLNLYDHEACYSKWHLLLAKKIERTVIPKVTDVLNDLTKNSD
jgi:hypothetical protein